MPLQRRRAETLAIDFMAEEDDDGRAKRARLSKINESSDLRSTSSSTGLSNKSYGISASQRHQSNLSTGVPSKITASSLNTSSKSTMGSTTWQSDTSAFSLKKCHAWFNQYATTVGEPVIDPEGMEKFCEDIGVEPENVVMLAIAYKMNASQMGYFTVEEWLHGMSNLQCDSTDKLIHKLEYLRSLLTDSLSFKPIFRYAFDFAKESGTRCMSIDVALSMLQLLLRKIWSLFPQFCRFLENSNYKVLNRDQWLNIYEFSLQISPDLSNYDEDGAWPALLDEFVSWLRENK